MTFDERKLKIVHVTVDGKPVCEYIPDHHTNTIMITVGWADGTVDVITDEGMQTFDTPEELIQFFGAIDKQMGDWPKEIDSEGASSPNKAGEGPKS